MRSGITDSLARWADIACGEGSVPREILRSELAEALGAAAGMVRAVCDILDGPGPATLEASVWVDLIGPLAAVETAAFDVLNDDRLDTLAPIDAARLARFAHTEEESP